MINTKILAIMIILTAFTILFDNSFAQLGKGDSPFERDFGDVKYLDSYFGTFDEKLEVDPGDQNVPFTVVFANVGTQDITGIRGQLSMPFSFSSSDGPGSLIYADSDSNALAGDNFSLTFFVNVSDTSPIGQYPASVKLDYSRLRESGIRNAFFDFDFKLTGDSVINVRALEPFLTSLQNNHVIIEIENAGTAPISGVDVVLTNTQGTISSTSQSVTNVENVVVLESNWDVGHIKPKQSSFIEANIYVPISLKGDTLRAPIEITYFNSHGDKQTISRIVDFYVKGFIDLTIYDVDVIDLAERHLVIGEIINEGNEDGLFGFVSLEPKGDSNIKKQTQFIDEIEVDSPVPFNIPLEFDGEYRSGEHDIQIIVRYKDNVRDEHFVTYDTTIFVEEKSQDTGPQFDFALIIIPIIIAVAAVVIIMRKRKKSHQETV